ncbi:glycoside hydrolase domain-containing protein [Niabella hirudinis]|uniref:glycoside hydrolase domain-containing protein n=1 Tax=Niabella hirudinis TaxID=1285929 RepID=UPI003EB86489
MIKKLLLLIVLLPFALVAYSQVHAYSVAETPWPETLGNHRAVIECQEGKLAHVILFWRRHDRLPEQKRLLILSAGGDTVRHIYRIAVDNERAEFVFEPVSGKGTYYVYYLPWQGRKENGWFAGDYLKPEATPDAAWMQRQGLPASAAQLPLSKVNRLEARTEFDSFYPMEVTATAAELRTLMARHPQKMILFPEDRKFPIRMRDHLPYKWIRSGPAASFSGAAQRNEYYTFQVGVFAAGTPLKGLKVRFGSAPFALTCFNTGGRDSRGVAFTRAPDVAEGTVQPLWIGVDVPENTKPGRYTFTVFIAAEGIPEQQVPVALQVGDKIIAERGDHELWRHSRLRWLNSTLGIDDAVVAPYTALKRNGNTISGSTTAATLGTLGLPESIRPFGTAVLAAPIAFIVETDTGVEKWNAGKPEFINETGGLIRWKVRASNQRLTLDCTGTMEADGYMRFHIAVSGQVRVPIKDIRLQLPLRKSSSKYFMGMGLPGCETPVVYDWKWKGPQDAFWMGDVHAGIFCELRGASYSGPLLNLYHPPPPPAWYNQDKGGFRLYRQGTVQYATVYSGERMLDTTDTLRFEFALLSTPVKQTDTWSQFTNRYYHNGSDPLPKEADLKTGIKIFNVHHANAINPYINYPFITTDTIRAVADTWHKKGMKMKLYYTTRELTNQVPELWALRSLGSEVLADGKGGGYVWLREHLVDHYNPQWFTTIGGYERSDAALLTSGDSRWYNYYIEGLRWLVRYTGIDGLYLDDVSYDRDLLKRMRKVMDGVKPGCIIDLHSNTGFSKGPATQYTEFFPYINKLWFGESFQYNNMSAANWLVEVSGLPFGLMGDMLHGGGNPWRGMVYGMTVRYPWYTEGVSCDPKDIWKVWDDFGIAGAKMVGYWEKDPVVTTDNPAVLATAYIRDNRLLVAVASWAADTVAVKLNINWQRIGWTSKNRFIKAPAIRNFQPEQRFNGEQHILLAPQKGWLFIIDK